MKRTIIAAIICIVLSLIPLQPTEITLNILYGLIGVLFSVAMSLIITFDGSKIRNSDLKKSIRNSIHDTRNNFLVIFAASSIFFVVYSLLPKSIQHVIWLEIGTFKLSSTWSVSILFFLLYTIIVLIYNYIDLQQLYEDIEDKLIEEKNKK
jgi:hypothetical protein